MSSRDANLSARNNTGLPAHRHDRRLHDGRLQDLVGCAQHHRRRRHGELEGREGLQHTSNHGPEGQITYTLKAGALHTSISFYWDHPRRHRRQHLPRHLALKPSQLGASAPPAPADTTRPWPTRSASIGPRLKNWSMVAPLSQRMLNHELASVSVYLFPDGIDGTSPAGSADAGGVLSVSRVDPLTLEVPDDSGRLTIHLPVDRGSYTPPGGSAISLNGATISATLDISQMEITDVSTQTITLGDDSRQQVQVLLDNNFRVTQLMLDLARFSSVAGCTVTGASLSQANQEGVGAALGAWAGSEPLASRIPVGFVATSDDPNQTSALLPDMVPTDLQWSTTYNSGDPGASTLNTLMMTRGDAAPTDGDRGSFAPFATSESVLGLTIIDKEPAGHRLRDELPAAGHRHCLQGEHQRLDPVGRSTAPPGGSPGRTTTAA